MGSLAQSLMTKIKTLNEKVWEGRAREPAIMAWLDNFADSSTSGLDERTHALFLLSNFMYFGDREIRELLKALYRDLYRYPIIESIRRTNNDTLDSEIIDPLFKAKLGATRFLGVGNPSESGCHLLYYFRQENSLSRNLFIHTHQIFKRNIGFGLQELREPAITRYIFIDDFCGSGKQGVEYSREIVGEIKRLNAGAIVEYYVLFATTKGMDRVRNETDFDSAKAIYELDSSFKSFSSDSRCFIPPLQENIDRTFCEQMCTSYGKKLVIEARHALGFEDSQLLIGFHHNTPDNTLPIIWFDEPSVVPWTPIFRRYPKSVW